MEDAIKIAERNGDFSKVEELLQKSLTPFRERQENNEGKIQIKKRPDSRFDI